MNKPPPQKIKPHGSKYFYVSFALCLSFAFGLATGFAPGFVPRVNAQTDPEAEEPADTSVHSDNSAHSDTSTHADEEPTKNQPLTEPATEAQTTPTYSGPLQEVYIETKNILTYSDFSELQNQVNRQFPPGTEFHKKSLSRGRFIFLLRSPVNAARARELLHGIALGARHLAARLSEDQTRIEVTLET